MYWCNEEHTSLSTFLAMLQKMLLYLEKIVKLQHHTKKNICQSYMYEMKGNAVYRKRKRLNTNNLEFKVIMSFLYMLIKLQIFSRSRVQYMRVVKTEARRDGSDSEEEDNLTFHLVFVYFSVTFMRHQTKVKVLHMIH